MSKSSVVCSEHLKLVPIPAASAFTLPQIAACTPARFAHLQDDTHHLPTGQPGWEEVCLEAQRKKPEHIQTDHHTAVISTGDKLPLSTTWYSEMQMK